MSHCKKCAVRAKKQSNSFIFLGLEETADLLVSVSVEQKVFHRGVSGVFHHSSRETHPRHERPSCHIASESTVAELWAREPSFVWLVSFGGYSISMPRAFIRR